jgi:peptidoglycan/xylan/chitin deacetylase (PgdA/CDA1 family)
MPRRRALLTAPLASLLAACGVSRRPAARPPAPNPAGSGSPSASAGSTAASPPGGSASPSPTGTGHGPHPTASGSGPDHGLRPGTGTSGPFGSRSLTGSDGVALTFDDGPDVTYTPQILDLLKQYGVQATFCVIGSRARDYPDLIKRIVADGHNLANHSWQHLMDLGKRPSSYQNWDLRNTLDTFHAAVPDEPIRYFRAPGGNYTAGLVQLASSLGMTSLYWDVDPRDWDAATYGRGAPMVSHIVAVVKGTTRPGSIILSHDRVRPDTIAAYKILLPWLKAHFRMVRLP